MKKLLERFRGASRAPAGAESSGYFSSMFVDQAGDEAPAVATWGPRGKAIGAEPFDAAQGAELFARLWAEDRHALALDAQELQRLAAYLEFVKLPPGREVIAQDEQGDYLLLVLDGTFAVDRLQPWGGRARLAEARRGDMLGEMSLFDAGARFSACSTLTPCVAGVLDATRLDRLMQDEPRLALALMTSISRRLSLRLRQVSARLSALLSRS